MLIGFIAVFCLACLVILVGHVRQTRRQLEGMVERRTNEILEEPTPRTHDPDALSGPAEPRRSQSPTEEHSAGRVLLDSSSDHTSVQDESDSPIDLSQFDALSTGEAGREQVLDILQSFIDDSSATMATLERAVHERACDDVHQAAHRVKGACLIVGARRASGLASVLEARAAAGECDALHVPWEALREEFDRVVAALRAHLGES